MKASDIRRGHIVLIEGQPCRVMDFQHRTPGNLRAFVQLRLRNLLNGNTFDQRVSATEFVEDARLDMHDCQVLFRDEAGVHCMDTHSYEQYVLDSEIAGDAVPWLEPELHIQLEMLDGKAIGVQLPAVGEYAIVETAPVMRSATKTASTKPARLSNGVTVQVPEFVAEGDRIRVDPRSGMYLERAK